MAGIAPRFALQLGALASDSASPAGGPAYFVVERALSVPADGLRIWLSGRGEVAPGDPATLELGDEDGTERVFTGTVAEVRPRAGAAEVFCVGKMLGLLELRVSEQYLQQSAGDVVRDLAGRAGMEEGEVSDGVTLPRFAVERRMSAFPQLRALARRHGFDLFTDREGKLHFRGLGEAASLGSGGIGGALASAGAAALDALTGGGALGYGAHLVETRGHVRPDPARRITVGGESPASGQGEDTSFWLTARDTDFQDSAGDGAELLVLDPAARTKDMAGRFAAGYLAGLRRTRRELRLTVTGDAALELGDPLQAVDAPDPLLNARGFVSSIRHRFGAGVGFLSDVVLVVEDDG